MPLAICNGSLRLRVKLRINGSETDVQLVSKQVVTLHHQANTTQANVVVALLMERMAKSTMLRTHIVGDKFRSFDTAVVKQLRSKNIFDQTIKSPLKF